MTPQQLVALFARLFALWLFINALRMLVGVVAIEGQLGGGGKFAWLAGAVLPVAVGLVLWNFPQFIAGKLIPRTNGTNTIALRPRQMAAVGSALLGMWTIIQSVPLAYEVIREIQLPGYGSGTWGTVRQLLIAALFGAGVFLLAQPWFLADHLIPARDVKTDLPESSNPLT